MKRWPLTALTLVRVLRERTMERYSRARSAWRGLVYSRPRLSSRLDVDEEGSESPRNRAGLYKMPSADITASAPVSRRQRSTSSANRTFPFAKTGTETASLMARIWAYDAKPYFCLSICAFKRWKPKDANRILAPLFPCPTVASQNLRSRMLKHLCICNCLFYGGEDAEFCGDGNGQVLMESADYDFLLLV